MINNILRFHRIDSFKIMAYPISSEDMLSISLILSDYDINTSSDEVFKRVESYQQSQSDYFGETENDFRMVFIQLGVELEWFGWRDVIDDLAATLSPILLKQWTTPLLDRYDYAWFNDSEEGWWIQVDSNSQRRQMMREFLSQPENHSIKKIRKFLEQRFGWKKEYLREFLTHVDKENSRLFTDEDKVLRLRLPEHNLICCHRE